MPIPNWVWAVLIGFTIGVVLPTEPSALLGLICAVVCGTVVHFWEKRI